MADLLLKRFFGFSFKDVRPLDSVLQMEDSFPVLFIHCKNDKIVPFYMFEKLFESKKGNKESLIVENAEHAKAVFVDSDKYQSHVESFLRSQGYLNE